MTVVDNVFPQSGDADFAENFATWLGRGNISSYVETGLNLTVDYASSPPTVDISEGKSYIILDQSTISSNNETRLNLDYAITTGAVSGLAVNEAEDNNLLYLNPNIGVNDSPSFEVETSTGNAGANWLLIGVIDTVSDTTETRNRNPDADFGSLTSRNSFSLPVYSELSAADSSEASVVFIDGNGSDKQGVYVDNGTEFITVGVRQISELTDVTGVDSIDANSGSNRPAAGTAGRVFIDTSGNSIQFDTGSAWVDIGTNPSNIGAGDLGFNTATQSELDTHISETDAHHSPPTAGDGLQDQSNTFNIEPADFSGRFLSDDGSDNLEVNIGNGLAGDGSNNIELVSDSVTVSAGDGLKNGGVVSLGESTTLNVEPNEFAGSGLTDDGADNLELVNNSISVLSGNGLKSGGEVSLGSSVTLDIEPADFAGSGLTDDGNDSLQLTNDAITVSTGSNLSGGGTVALGGSVTLNATDTRTDVSDDTTLIESNVTDINFSSNLDVSADGDGSVRVDAASSTDTTTDISENGTTVVNQTTDINFDDNLDVVDDGDGSVTINARDTDTSVDVKDDGDFIGINVSEINFASNLDASTNDGGSTIVVDAQSSTDTTTDISENGTTVVNQTTDINFDDNLDVVDDGDSSVTVNATDTNTIPSVDDSGSFITNSASGFNFGSNLSVTDDGDGSVTVNATDTNTIPSVDDSGSFITNSASGFNFGSNLSVTDDGGGNVTIDASDTDTRVDVSDSGTAIGFNTSEINFSSNLDVSTNDGGSTIVVDAQSSTDTTTDVSENGTTIISQTDDINFTDSGGGNVSVSDDTDGTATVNIDHADTSSQATLNASAGAAITDITLDEYGHITEMGDTDFDSRFVRESGDTMSGQLTTTGVVFNDSNNDGDEWTIQENGSSGNLTIDDSVSVRMTVDQSGNVDIEGELTEGAVL
jgi:hypothetical protein